MKCALLTFKYFDEAFSISAMLERPAWSLAYIFFSLWLTAKERRNWEAINGCELVRMQVNASETQDVEFRIMVTDGKPWRNQKMVFISLWFRSGDIRCKWNPYYRTGGLKNKDKHCFKFTFCQHHFFVKMSIADCFTCLHSAHLFLRASGNYREAHSKQSSVKCEEKCLEKKQSLFTLDQRYQSHTKNERSDKREGGKCSHTHTCERTKQHHFSI